VMFITGTHTDVICNGVYKIWINPRIRQKTSTNTFIWIFGIVQIWDSLVMTRDLRLLYNIGQQ
jgi:hypothetical protein